MWFQNSSEWGRFAATRWLSVLTVVQVQTAKGARKKVLDESELVLQCESEAEREDWIRVLKLFATGP